GRQSAEGCLLTDADAPAPESVDPTPAARDVQERNVTDSDRERGIDDEQVFDRLEAEHRAKEQEGRPGRPGLGAACRRGLDGLPRQASRVAAKRRGKAAFEELGRFEDPGCDLRSLFLEAIPAEPPGDERVVERPDGADVVADRVVAAFALGEGADAPPREEPRAEQVARDRLRLRLVDDAAPEQMADVRAQRIDLLPVGIEREREVFVLADPV